MKITKEELFARQHALTALHVRWAKQIEEDPNNIPVLKKMLEQIRTETQFLDEVYASEQSHE